MNVIFGISLENETRLDDTNSYDTSYKVLDAFDYSSITTIDVKKNIYDLSVNVNGSYIALVENQSAYDSIQETFLKVYAVGAIKAEDQEEVSFEWDPFNKTKLNVSILSRMMKRKTCRPTMIHQVV